MKKNLLSRKKIIKLIYDDLSIKHTVWGLHLLGYTSERSPLDMCQTVFLLMSLNTHDGRLDHLVSVYSERAYRVTEIAVKDDESLKALAVEIYNWLKAERKKYLKLTKP